MTASAVEAVATGPQEQLSRASVEAGAGLVNKLAEASNEAGLAEGTAEKLLAAMGSMIFAVDMMSDDTERMSTATATEAEEEGSGALGEDAPIDCTELIAAAANSSANRTSSYTYDYTYDDGTADADADAAAAAAANCTAAAAAAAAAKAAEASARLEAERREARAAAAKLTQELVKAVTTTKQP